jgi:predicted ATPase
MNLKEIRESEPKIGPTDEFISPSGQNLAIVFDNLHQRNIDFEEKINTRMKSVLPMTKKIRVVRSGRLRLSMEWHVEDATEPFYLNDMSDGSVRMLSWAVILNSPALPSLLVIDEPELGLHPAWMGTLAEWIKTASERTQVIVSTHSPDLLDHFSGRVSDVVCFRFDGKNHFTPKRLTFDTLKPKIDEGWELGDLYRVGDPDVGGWPW